jgi:hypothetical protein
LEGGDRALALRAIQQFVAKIVIKNGTGTLYYTFPLDVDMSSFQAMAVMLAKMNVFLRVA